MINVNVGDKVIRNLAGIELEFEVTDMRDGRIICGPWEFDQKTGAEIDDDLGWGPNGTGSCIYVKDVTNAE